MCLVPCTFAFASSLAFAFSVVIFIFAALNFRRRPRLAIADAPATLPEVGFKEKRTQRAQQRRHDTLYAGFRRTCNRNPSLGDTPGSIRIRNLEKRKGIRGKFPRHFQRFPCMRDTWRFLPQRWSRPFPNLLPILRSALDDDKDTFEYKSGSQSRHQVEPSDHSRRVLGLFYRSSLSRIHRNRRNSHVHRNSLF